MNLETALKYLTVKPRSMIESDGRSVPAVQYTTRFHSALAWLCARYNDGTLQVIGYESHEEGAKKKIQTYDKRRNGYEPRTNEMTFREFVKQTKLEYRVVKKMAEQAQALFRPDYYLYIDVEKFYKYWDDIKVKEKYRESYVNLGTAATMLGILPMEAKRLCESGEIIRRIRNVKSRDYYISVNSINEYLKRKGEENGENNSNNS
jgi:hypothetical protein